VARLVTVLLAAAAALSVALAVAATPARPGSGVPAGPADATIDLATMEGVRLINGAWRYSDVKIVETDFRSVGGDLKPSGPPNRTYDLEPRAGAADFDDSSWEIVDPTTLAGRRGNGRISFNWYRINLTLPERIGDFDPTGSTAVFEITVDDYAEVWVDGQLPRQLGQSGENLVAGWNVPNRLVVGRNVRPGQRIQLAVFGINGPLSDPPANFIWVRSAKLDFYREPRAVVPYDAGGEIVRLDPAIDAIVPRDARIEKVAEGFLFTEGPVWIPEGYLLFSDPNANRIYKWAPDGMLSVFREASGYTGADIAEYGQPGSNGLTLDAQGRLTINEHGNRRVTRLERDGTLTVLASSYQSKRLNSPNDLVYRSDGTLYFTDPPFGLPKFSDDPRKELAFSGIYKASDGKVQLVSRDLTGPNGIAFSPDEKSLYVGDWDEKRKIVMRYPVNADGSLGAGAVFIDMTSATGEDAIDGIKVDKRGNVYVSGPGGLWILSPDGTHLGTIVGPEHPHNFAWGDADGRTLYLCARTGLYRIRLSIPGVRPAEEKASP
jgi:gluconolactonase